MFGLRYGITRSLDLRSSLVHIDFDGFLGNGREVADTKVIRGPRQLDADGKRDPGEAVDPFESKPENLDSAPDAALNTVEDPDVNNPKNSNDKSAKAEAKGNEPLPPGDDPLDSGGKGQNSPPASDPSSPNSSPGANSQSGKQQSGAQDGSQKQGPGDNSSLADKVRDALANLMAKLKPQSNQGRKTEQFVAISRAAVRAPAKPDTRWPAEAIARAGAERRQLRRTVARRAAAGRFRTSLAGQERSAQQQSTQFARRQERHRQAGRRQDRARSRRTGRHGQDQRDYRQARRQCDRRSDGRGVDRQAAVEDAVLRARRRARPKPGGEINRDEVPLAYQQYVQQYFAEIRKLARGQGQAASESAKPKGAAN